MRTIKTSILLLCALLLGCNNTERPIRIGTGVWPGFEPLYLAREQGLFHDSDIRLVELPSSREVINALIAGDLEGAGVSIDEAISIAAEGVALQIVLVCDISDGADAIVTHDSSTLESSIENGEFALNFGTTGRLLLDAAATSLGIDQTSLSLVNLAPDQQVKAWEQGQINSAITREPYLSQLIDRGAKTIFSSSEIRGRIVDVLVIREDKLNQYRQQISMLTKSYFEAQKALLSMTEENITLATKRQQLSSAQLENVYTQLHMPGLEENHRLLDTENGRLSRTTNTLVSLMQMNGMLPPKTAIQLQTSADYLPVP